MSVLSCLCCACIVSRHKRRRVGGLELSAAFPEMVEDAVLAATVVPGQVVEPAGATTSSTENPVRPRPAQPSQTI
jgi:hypothetical protein